MNQDQAKLLIQAYPPPDDLEELRLLLNRAWQGHQYQVIQDLARDGAVMLCGKRVTSIQSSHHMTEYTAIPKRRVNWRKVMVRRVFVKTSQRKSSIEPIIGIQHRLDGSTHIRLIGGAWYPEDEIILKDLPDEYYEDVE